MRLQVKGKNVEITPSLRQYVETKVAKLDKHLADLTQVELELSEEKNPSIAASQIAEGTIFTKGSTLRAREAAREVRTAVDQLVDNLERQAKRYREKRTEEPRRRAHSPRRVGRRGTRGASVDRGGSGRRQRKRRAWSRLRRGRQRR